MSTPSPGGDAASAASVPGVVTTVTATDVPLRADNVQLIGQMPGSGYRVPPALARRADGQVVQLTPLLHEILAACDGRRTYSQIAHTVTAETGTQVSEDNVRTLVETKLRHTGLLANADGTQPETKKAQPLLGLRFRYAVTDPERTRRLTSPFTFLFHPALVTLVLAAFALVSWWLLFDKGLASATSQAFNRPALFLVVVVVTVLSAGFHEFGHAAAARRGGATPGAMGTGIYLVWPAFYTDVTDSYRLGRGGRLRTDLGGLYFNAIVAIAIVGAWWATSYDALLLVVVAQILQMIRQLTPLVRFDGYHVLADLTGVPDLFHRIKPTLIGLLPWRWSSPEATVLKPWARSVVSVWVLLVVPILAFSLFTLVITLPRVIGTAWSSLGRQQDLMSAAFGDGDLVGGAGRLLGMLALTFPIVASVLILGRLVKQVGGGAWRSTEGRPVRRSGVALIAAALVAALAFAWWPRGDNYRPIMPYERGTLVDAANTLPINHDAPTGLSVGQRGTLATAWPDADARPTREAPQLALVLVPREQPASGHAESWVFPFNKPLKPGKGDNQALAVNTEDGTIQYDIAFALVWVTGDSPALQKNESYALASCSDCAAVSIAFQVVLVTGDNHVAAPQNIAAAVNYDCTNCLTYALATQLFVTLDGPLSEDAMREIAALWEEIAAFGATIEDVPLSEIQDRLEQFEERILAVVDEDQTLNQEEPVTDPTPTTDGSATPPEPADSGDPSATTPSPATSATTSEPEPVETTQPVPTPEPTTSEPAPAG